MNLINHQFRLAARPVGMPKRGDWNYTEEPVRDPGDGEVLIKVLYVSLDPAMRGWMNEGKSYIRPVAIGEVMRAGGAGKVIASNNPKFAVGDYAYGTTGIQEYCLASGNEFNKVDPKIVPLPVYLSALGMTGMTAYFGLLDVGQPKAGDTVVVSGAAGATGSVVGQIAKIKGGRVVGIAGGAEKCAYLQKDLGFDGAIDYKSENLPKALRERCPKGIDVYFDNVGGDTLDAVLAQINLGARIAICGAISQYNNTTPIKGPSNYLSLLINRASMKGFIVFDYTARFGEAARDIAGWLKAGKLKSREDIVDGLQTFPETLLKLFKGENKGKLLIKVAGE
ncbi:MAG: NADP-dependent oxidoreductase [Candidatus Acidiferrum sp.]